ncbi:MAG: ABC transporter ATP-binding protein [Oligoflexales bacterium]
MLVEVKDLSISFDTLRGELKAIDRISFDLAEGEVLGIVGESGCGKSITSLALMGLLPTNASLSASKLLLNGRDLTRQSRKEWQALRGKEMSMIFQDPMTSLDPSFTIGYQIMETLKIHDPAPKNMLKDRVIELLNLVGIPDPRSQLNAYPHQLSGGMCQRVMIAIAIACKPKLLIADEPTTALDVTIQAQILTLLRTLQKQTKMALILITHDIAVVSEMADKIAVMYAGQIVETGKVDDIINDPRHPYTNALLSCLPESHESDGDRSALASIPGLVPDLVNRPTGCQLHPRCQFADDYCKANAPALSYEGERYYTCFKPLKKRR